MCGRGRGNVHTFVAGIKHAREGEVAVLANNTAHGAIPILNAGVAGGMEAFGELRVECETYLLTAHP